MYVDFIKNGHWKYVVTLTIRQNNKGKLTAANSIKVTHWKPGGPTKHFRQNTGYKYMLIFENSCPNGTPIVRFNSHCLIIVVYWLDPNYINCLQTSGKLPLSTKIAPSSFHCACLILIIFLCVAAIFELHTQKHGDIRLNMIT